MLAELSAVPLRVSLAALARLRSYRTVCKELSENPVHVERLAEAIAMSALEGLDQFYEAYLSFTSVFGYHHSAVCVTLAEALPELLSMLPEAVERKQWASACESFTNTATAAGRLGKYDLQARINKSAVTFAAALDLSQVVEPFVARAIAKTYISAGMPQPALNRIDKIHPDRVDHWLLYQKSKAQLELKMFELSLRTAEAALESAQQDQQASGRLAAYFDQLSKCAEKLEDFSLSKSYSENAINCCEDALYLRDLQARHELLTCRSRDLI